MTPDEAKNLEDFETRAALLAIEISEQTLLEKHAPRTEAIIACLMLAAGLFKSSQKILDITDEEILKAFKICLNGHNT